MPVPAVRITYAINPNDVGRKVRCKRCGATLLITPEGLTLEGVVAGAVATSVPSASGSVPPASVPVPPVPPAPDQGYGEVPAPPFTSSYQRRSTPAFSASLAAIGGIPTILFVLGVVLVLWFSYMVPIGEAAAGRARARVDLLELEQKLEIQRLKSKEGNPKEGMEKINRIMESYEPKLQQAENDAAYSQISSLRSRWFDLYGQLVGFLLVALGCIGYLRTAQPLVVQILAAGILGGVLLVAFMFGVGGCENNPRRTVSTHDPTQMSRFSPVFRG